MKWKSTQRYVVEDVANIHNYNDTDDDESNNDNMDDENTIT